MQLPPSPNDTLHLCLSFQAVPYQPTVTQFFKRQTKDNLNHTEQINPNPTFISEDVKQEGDFNRKNVTLKSPYHDLISKRESIQRKGGETTPSKSRNPISNGIGGKTSSSSDSSKEVTSAKTFTNADQESTMSKHASISTTKSLSLKTRKRKHRTTVTSPDQERVSKKSCKSPSVSVTNSSSSIKKAIKIEETTSNENDLSGEDLEILARYTQSGIEVLKHPKLSDLEDYSKADRNRAQPTGGVRTLEQTEPSKQCQQNNCSKEETSQISNSVQLSSKSLRKSLIKKQSKLPDSPSFSPRKSTPKCFSPLLRGGPSHSLSKEGSSQLFMDTSLPLFATPQEQRRSAIKEVSVLSSHSPSSGGLSKRVLFPSNDERQPLSSLSNSTANKHQTILAEDAEDEYGFEGDFNLSDIMDQSELLSELDVSLADVSNRLNRSLVLEKVSQMSTDHETDGTYGR